MMERDRNGSVYWSTSRDFSCDASKLAQLAEEDLPSLFKLDQDGLGAIHIAARYGATAAVMLILKLGGDPRQKSSDGYTPLMMAAGRGHVDLARRILLAAGPQSRLDIDGQGRTALEWAIRQSQGESAKMLLPEVGEAALDSNRLPMSWLADENELPEISAELSMRELAHRERLDLQAHGSAASLSVKPPKRV